MLRSWPITRLRTMALAIALTASMLNATSVAATDSPILHDGGSGWKQVALVYFPDDICGTRAGWTEFVTTWHWAYTELADGAFNFLYVETGTYHTDFDDPTIPPEDSQFTGAEHATATMGDTLVHTAQWHDFPGTITIHEQLLFVQVGDEIQLDRYVLRVDGCP